MALVIQIKATSKQAAREIKDFARKSGSEVKKLEKQSAKSSKAMSAAFTAFKGVLAGGVVGAIVASTKQVLNQVDAIGKLSGKLGESTEFLSQMQFVAEQSGVQFNNLTMAMQRANRRISEFASTGKGEAAPAIKELGLQIKNADGSVKSFEELLPDLADAFGKVTSAGDRTRLAFKLFDSEGVELIKILSAGSEGIKQLREQADFLGRTITTEMALKAAEANDAINRLNSAFKGFALQTLPATARAVADVVNGITAFLLAVKEIGAITTFFTAIKVGLLNQVGLHKQAADEMAKFVIANEEAVTKINEMTKAQTDFNTQLGTGVNGLSPSAEREKEARAIIFMGNAIIRVRQEEAKRLQLNKDTFRETEKINVKLSDMKTVQASLSAGQSRLTGQTLETVAAAEALKGTFITLTTRVFTAAITQAESLKDILEDVASLLLNIVIELGIRAAISSVFGAPIPGAARVAADQGPVPATFTPAFGRRQGTIQAPQDTTTNNNFSVGTVVIKQQFDPRTVRRELIPAITGEVNRGNAELRDSSTRTVRG